MAAPPSQPNGKALLQTEDEIAMQNLSEAINKHMKKRRNKWTLIVTFLSLVLIIIFITIAFLVSKGLLSHSSAPKTEQVKSCSENEMCEIQIVETIPKVLEFKSGSPKHDETSTHWKQLITTAQTNIDIISFYWTLNGTDIEGGPYEQAKVGEEILNALIKASQRGVQIRIVQTMASKNYPQTDTEILATYPNIEVRSLNMTRLIGSGILHTKAIVTDKSNFYVGSANFDWRSLTEVKELGIVLYNCSCAGEDIQKIFEVNWMLGVPAAAIPYPWPEEYQSNFGKDSPMTIRVQPANSPARVYFSTSPPQFCAGRRTSDLNAILDIIQKAKKFVYIAVMDYYAAIIYDYPKKFWPTIDNALREAVFDRGIEVRLLSSNWTHTNLQQIAFLKSLNEFGKMAYVKGCLQVKQFTVPTSTIPYARVNHNKYMVSDNAGFVSTSNWSGDYFISTAGISLVINQTDGKLNPSDKMIQQQLKEVFLRDWDSDYSKDLK